MGAYDLEASASSSSSRFFYYTMSVSFKTRMLEESLRLVRCFFPCELAHLLWSFELRRLNVFILIHSSVGRLSLAAAAAGRRANKKGSWNLF